MIRPLQTLGLLADPKAEWTQPAITTFGLNNHAVRSDGARYIRYANGDEELYDEIADPKEWTNLANLPEHATKKAELAQLLPTQNAKEVTNPAANPNRAQRRAKAAAE